MLPARKRNSPRSRVAIKRRADRCSTPIQPCNLAGIKVVVGFHDLDICLESAEQGFLPNLGRDVVDITLDRIDQLIARPTAHCPHRKISFALLVALATKRALPALSFASAAPAPMEGAE